MDYTVIALLGVIVLTIVLANRVHSRTWAGRPGHQYQRVITLVVFGLVLTIAGAIGWDLSRLHGFFEGTRWVHGPLWGQVALGAALLAGAVVLARRMPPDATRSTTRAQ